VPHLSFTTRQGASPTHRELRRVTVPTPAPGQRVYDVTAATESGRDAIRAQGDRRARGRARSAVAAGVRAVAREYRHGLIGSIGSALPPYRSTRWRGAGGDL
jgi:hypothetical protein